MAVAGTVLGDRLPYKGSFLGVAQVATALAHDSTLTTGSGKITAILLALWRRVVFCVVLLFLSTRFWIARIVSSATRLCCHLNLRIPLSVPVRGSLE